MAQWKPPHPEPPASAGESKDALTSTAGLPPLARGCHLGFGPRSVPGPGVGGIGKRSALRAGTTTSGTGAYIFFFEFPMSRSQTAKRNFVPPHEKVVLPKADWDLFFEALIVPTPPNETLKSAVRRFRDRFFDASCLAIAGTSLVRPHKP